MPLSMTFLLKALDDLPQGRWRKRWQEALIRTLLSSLEVPEMSQANEKGAYLLSPFMPAESGQDRGALFDSRSSRAILVKQQERFRLCVRCLDDHYLEPLAGKISSASLYPLRVEEDGLAVLIEAGRISSSLSGKWNRCIPYGRLVADASNSLRIITLKFASATTLIKAELKYPLPDPALIFSGYHDLWTTFSGLPLSEELPQMIETCLALVDFRLRKSAYWLDQETVTGFMGSATFQLQGRHPESIIKDLNTLADYALFCGTGIGRKEGMGLTRRI